jgi:hypothetical protein
MGQLQHVSERTEITDKCGKSVDAHGILRRAGTAAKKADQVPHVGSQRHIPADPSLYKHMSNFSKGGASGTGARGRK